MIQPSLFNDTSANIGSIDWQPTRAAGLARLAAFLPSAGLAYAHTRNTDFGPENRSNVSALSPWLARRMITEPEVLAAVIAAHGVGRAEKFIQEVFWRTYWKGWLEHRPNVLDAFNRDRISLNQAMSSGLAKRLMAAQTGHTGIECFDAWAQELVTYGWLHNHARMWFASIWIFTLRLPWQLGADFFYKNLLDADVASNTLSWRWVAGLHTKGKHYLARARNIALHTDGRFNPEGQLNEAAEPLPEPFLQTAPQALPPAQTIMADQIGLLITQEDLHPESLPIAARVAGIACLTMPDIGAPLSPRNQFSRGALDDASARAQDHFGHAVERVSSAVDIIAWAKRLGVTEIVTATIPKGLVAWAMADAKKALAGEGIRLTQIRRPWDAKAWPLATGGFFKLKEKLPRLLEDLVA